MAVLCALLLSLLVLGTLSAQEPASGPVLPHLTGCVSNNMETFRCSWNVGTFQNLSQPGDLKLFYIKKTAEDLRECPQYGPPGTSQCFFSENHTSIWTNYRVQLLSRDRSVHYDDEFFNIEEIVRPDPPTQLNWTLLTVAKSGNNFDARLSWEAPESADVKNGWLRLQYQVQHRGGAGGAGEPWKSKDLQRHAETSLYGLKTNVDYEVRVRCKILSGKEFGPFSDSIIIHVPSQVSRFPIAILLIFAALCFIGVLMLVMQQKLMVILLPAVPGPKIRGIDQELLKKGDLSELMSVLGGHADLKMNNNNPSDPWVEFIDLDMEEEEPSDGAGADGSPSSARAPLSSLGSRDDCDSGRDSFCCDAPSDHAGPASCEPVFRQQGPEDGPGQEPSVWVPRAPGPPVPAQGPVGPGDLYTQVSHVQRSGEVLLAPGEMQELGEEQEEEKGKGNAKMNFRLEVVADQVGAGGYSSERDTGKTRLEEPGATHPPLPPPPMEYQSNTGAYTLALPQSYTLVEGVDKQNSLLLRPSNSSSACQCTPKTVPTPEGYLTPDLLRDIAP